MCHWLCQCFGELTPGPVSATSGDPHVDESRRICGASSNKSFGVTQGGRAGDSPRTHMFPVHIPILTLHKVTIHGHVENRVVCERCGCEFRYVAVRAATGSVQCLFEIVTKRMESRAAARARKRLEVALKTPDMVACPECGWYQQDMVRYLRSRRLKAALVLSGFVAFLGLEVGLACVGQISLTLIALLLAAGAVAWILIFVLHFMRDPNSCRDFERQARAAASEGVPIAVHRQRQAKLQATEDTFDWMDPANLRERQKRADEQRRRGKQRAHRRRSATLMSIVAVTMGAVLGALFDAAIFGTPRDLTDRIALAAFIAPMGGLLVWLLMTIFSEVESDGWRPPQRSRPPLDFATVNARAVLVGTALPATLFAAGLRHATLHGCAIVLGGEALLLFALGLAFPRDRSG